MTSCDKTQQAVFPRFVRFSFQIYEHLPRLVLRFYYGSADTFDTFDACPPPAILEHEIFETLPCAVARFPRIRLAAHPLCPDLCLALLPPTNLIGM